MGECRGGGGGDGLIKLFGKTIPVPEAGDAAATAAKDLEQHCGGSSSSTESDGQESTPADPSPQPEVVDAEDPKSSPEEQSSGGGGEDAASLKEKLRKPDKVLPCPRCSSMDTKFCYFNNYNVNQPRHFCKNCQRYWTAGGAMRNVPVGAGRRKNKNAIAASHFLQHVRAALPAAADPAKASGGGTVLSFGRGHGAHRDAPATALDLAEQMAHLKETTLVPVVAGDSHGHPSVGSCSEVSSGGRDDRINRSNAGNETATVEKPAAMWPYSCAPSPAYYASGAIAIPIYPAAAPAYWGCMVPGAWGLPWPVQSQSQALSSPTNAPSLTSVPTSLALGKHPREGDEGRVHGGGGGKVWVPKTIRIDNADEVAMSSIRSLIGISTAGDDKNVETAGTTTGGYKLASTTVFEPRRDAKMAAKHAAVITSLPLLHANPVALTRSANFQEGS